MAEMEQQAKEERRNVLICMDGSKHAIYAFEWYVKNLHRPTDNVLMAHCADNYPYIPLDMSASPFADPNVMTAMMKEQEADTLELFRKIDLIANNLNIKHTLERLRGPPGESIIAAAEQQNASMIIAGSRGHGSIMRTIIGSTGDYLLHHSHVPVLIVKHEDEHYKLK